MKLIKIKERNSSLNTDFWEPWGVSGCLWRFIVFLLLLFLFLFLLSLNRTINNRYDGPSERIDSSLVNWPVNIADTIPELPADNVLPPVQPGDVVEDPENPIRQIVGNKLNVILLNSSNLETEIKSFAEQFKVIYPSPEYEVVYYNVLTGLMQLQVPAEHRSEVQRVLLEQIIGLSFIIFDESLLGSMSTIPNDAAFKHRQNSWYFAPIQAYEAWDIAMGDSTVVVAVIDSYFDLTHDELTGKIILPYSIENKTSDVLPPNGSRITSKISHGTHVAATAVGNANNAKGVCGIAPKCMLMPISLGRTLTSMRVLEGILYAIYQGADVINLSVGIDWPKSVASIPLEEQLAIAKEVWKEEQQLWEIIYAMARRHNCIIVYSAGNEKVLIGLDASKRSDMTIQVSAVDRKLHKADFSNYGNIAHANTHYSTISAPGVDILSAIPNNRYDIMNGTSMAAPIVTGAVALMRSLRRCVTAQDAIAILQSTAKPIEGDSTIGGLLQIKDALVELQRRFPTYEDLQNDHSKLVGIWEATTYIPGGEEHIPLELFMKFTNETEGELLIFEIKETEDGYMRDKLFTASLRVSYTESGILITQLERATAENSNTSYNIYEYRLLPNTTGLISCLGLDQQDNGRVNFELKKVE